jgi:hypothetical protein
MGCFGVGMLCVWWTLAVQAGLSGSKRARTPGGAFVRGALTAYLAAELLVAFACALLVAASPVWLAPWMAVWLLFGLPPALLAGPLAAVRAMQQPSPIPPAVEAAARARFVPSQHQPADAEAIQPADDEVREGER